MEELSIQGFSKLLEGEDANNLAFILTNLNSKYVSEFLNSYIGETDGIMKAMLDDNSRTKNQIIDLRNKLFVKYNKMIEDEKLNSNSKDVLVNVLNQLDQEKTKKYLDQINQIDEEVGIELREKIFLYSDIMKLNENEIENITLSTDHELMVRFLKSVDRDVQSKFLDNLTPRAASIIQEDMSYMGHIEQADQEKIQHEMLINIRNILQFIKD